MHEISLDLLLKGADVKTIVDDLFNNPSHRLYLDERKVCQSQVSRLVKKIRDNIIDKENNSSAR